MRKLATKRVQTNFHIPRIIGPTFSKVALSVESLFLGGLGLLS